MNEVKVTTKSNPTYGVSVKPGTPRNTPEHPRNTPGKPGTPRNTPGTPRNSQEQPRDTHGTSHNTLEHPRNSKEHPRNTKNSGQQSDCSRIDSAEDLRRFPILHKTFADHLEISEHFKNAWNIFEAFKNSEKTIN